MNKKSVMARKVNLKAKQTKNYKKSRNINWSLVSLVSIGIILIAFFFYKFNTYRQNAEISQTGLAHRHYRPVCPPGKGVQIRCTSEVVDDNTVNANGRTQPTPTGAITNPLPVLGSYGPLQFHTAYNFPCTPGGSVAANCASPSTFGPQTIAIVVTYDDPNLENDLNIYSKQYGLPSCTTANGCFTKHNMCSAKGSNKNQCYQDQGWGLEASMDTQVAHAICQTCKILVVEASYADWTDVMNAENYAASQAPIVISNSFGGSEQQSGLTTYAQAFNHPGIGIFASSGDNSYSSGASFPASAPTVTAVGGTTLNLNSDNTYLGESVWYNPVNGTGAGSGCSSLFSANTWQLGVPNWSQTGCGSMRGSADIAADADPNTGAAVYDSYGLSDGRSGWFMVGGTSLSSPLVAAAAAMAGDVSQYSNPQKLPYDKFNASNSHDITVGNNGTCTTSMCNAGVGYDGPTGLGSPNGVSGL